MQPPLDGPVEPGGEARDAGRDCRGVLLQQKKELQELAVEDGQDWERTDCTVLRHWTGKGLLVCKHGTEWPCSFGIEQLLNGRIRVTALFEAAWPKSDDALDRCEPFWLKGSGEDSTAISATEIHISHRISRFRSVERRKLVGYARSATLGARPVGPREILAIQLELSGTSIHIRLDPFDVSIDGYTVEMARLGYGNRNWKITEHGYGYRHPTVSSLLRVRGVRAVEEPVVTEVLSMITWLLSVADRGHVFPVTRIVSGEGSGQSYVELVEPPFTSQGHIRPLIPSAYLDQFVETALPGLRKAFGPMQLAFVKDHYFQGLTIRSAWPSSLGILTAMETLKTAFYSQRSGEQLSPLCWIVPPSDYIDNKQAKSDIIDVLAKHFPRFANLDQGERDSLKSQLNNLKWRTYRTQLRSMLNTLDVTYTPQEIDSFIDIRNTIIHSGAPLDPVRGWQQVTRAIRLFERVLLAILGYDGPMELFGETDVGQEGADHARVD